MVARLVRTSQLYCALVQLLLASSLKSARTTSSSTRVVLQSRQLLPVMSASHRIPELQACFFYRMLAGAEPSGAALAALASAAHAPTPANEQTQRRPASSGRARQITSALLQVGGLGRSRPLLPVQVRRSASAAPCLSRTRRETRTEAGVQVAAVLVPVAR